VGAVLACVVVLAGCSAGAGHRPTDAPGAAGVPNAGGTLGGGGAGGAPGESGAAGGPLAGHGTVGGRVVVRRGAFPPSEGSGVVASRSHRGVIWAIRDGGSPAPGHPRAALYAYRLAGDRLGTLPGGGTLHTIPVPGTTNVDWEDIGGDDQGNLWIADIGDNACRRASITLYKVREPDPAASSAKLLATYRFRYPDPDPGCRGWDAESLFLVGGMPYVISKSAFPAVYRATTLDSRRVTLLRRVGGLASGTTGPVVFPTGADLDVRTGRLAVASYATLAIYQAGDTSLKGEALVAELIGHSARWTVALGCLICPVSKLSLVEGVAFTGRHQDLTLLSERHDVWYVPTAAYER
jgi:hypothetical protein